MAARSHFHLNEILNTSCNGNILLNSRIPRTEKQFHRNPVMFSSLFPLPDAADYEQSWGFPEMVQMYLFMYVYVHLINKNLYFCHFAEWNRKRKRKKGCCSLFIWFFRSQHLFCFPPLQFQALSLRTSWFYSGCWHLLRIHSINRNDFGLPRVCYVGGRSFDDVSAEMLTLRNVEMQNTWKIIVYAPGIVRLKSLMGTALQR